MAIVFLNNFSTVTASPLAPADTVLELQDGIADIAAVLTGGNTLVLTLFAADDQGNETQREIIHVTAADEAAGTLTIERGKEGTTAGTWAPNTGVEQRLTAGVLDVVFNPPGDAPGENAVAMGAGTFAVGVDSVAINGNAIGDYSMGIGGQATGVGAVALGDGSNVYGVNAVGIGRDSSASDRTVALGAESSATSNGAISLGAESSANASKAIAIGHGTSANGEGALCMAGGSTSGIKAIAIGAEAYCGSDGGIVIGKDASGSASEVVVIGRGASSTADQSLVFGVGASSYSDNGSVVVGKDASALGDGALVLGLSTKARGDGATALGAHSEAHGGSSVALGAHSDANIDGGLQVNALSYLPASYNQSAVGAAPANATRQSAMQTVTATAEIDLTDATSQAELTFPPNVMLMPDSFDVIITGSDGAGGSPEIQIGPDSSNKAQYLGSTAVSKTAVGGRETHQPLSADGLGALLVSVAAAGTGTAYRAKVVVRGYAMEM